MNPLHDMNSTTDVVTITLLFSAVVLVLFMGNISFEATFINIAVKLVSNERHLSYFIFFNLSIVLLSSCSVSHTEPQGLGQITTHTQTLMLWAACKDFVPTQIHFTEFYPNCDPKSKS